ncbi:hypothetical protein NARC_30303 [Candidatus Nitrosocosmicus arcticus]|uniref:Uncharacterized protein n=1 Tax=Candidatus Nitrosocosmicus arcticus TaxID=2035267 RepID=A0A557SYB4_9ARCH|nr:hypothetical protein NARC_30303 [Candidatus Nitrosocosmicus arcticus]
MVQMSSKYGYYSYLHFLPLDSLDVNKNQTNAQLKILQSYSRPQTKRGIL